MNDLMKTQSDMIRSARLKKGFTQSEAAEKADIPVRTYQRLERGERDIRNTCMRVGLGICNALELDPFELVHGEEWQAEP